MIWPVLALLAVISAPSEATVLERAPRTGDAYFDRVQPLLSARCVGCHSCSVSPCQIDLSSYEGVTRGMDTVNPYAIHLGEVPPSRLTLDLPVREWRRRGFTPIASDSSNILLRALIQGTVNRPSSSGYSSSAMRALGRTHASSSYACPRDDASYDAFSRAQPFGGMPWGLPALEPSEATTLIDWADDGAPGPSREAQAAMDAPSRPDIVAAFEDLLNGSLARSLVGRYVFEHSFVSSLHFAEAPGEFYRLVRSYAAAPAAIDPVSTPRASDAPPRRAPVYYRLKKLTGAISAKKHIVWELSLPAIARMRAVFFGTPWSVSRLPGYPENPFEWMSSIPAAARSAFMRSHSRMIFQSLARGPICTGPIASYAVPDNLWIFYLAPEADPTVQNPKLGLLTWDSFYAHRAIPPDPAYWGAFEGQLLRLRPRGLGLEDVWNGAGTNPNAWLFGYRHETSSEVFHGGMPQAAPAGLPQSAWLMSYANFERMYYNAVVHFREWGSVPHKMAQFHFMSRARTEAENLYYSLIPDPALRSRLHRRTTSELGLLLNFIPTRLFFSLPTRMPMGIDERGLGLALWNHLGPAVRGEGDGGLNGFPRSLRLGPGPTSVDSIVDWERGVRALTSRRAPFVRHVPNLVYVRVRLGEETRLYTFFPNRAYRYDKEPLLQDFSRKPELDTLSVLPGVVGTMPHLFVDIVGSQRAAKFLGALARVETVEDWKQFRASFAITRADPRLWDFYDWLHEYQAGVKPAENGALDLRYYDL